MDIYFIDYLLVMLYGIFFVSIEAKQLIGIFLKTYNRDKQPYSLTMSNYELTNVLKQSKDETVVLTENAGNTDKRYELVLNEIIIHTQEII